MKLLSAILFFILISSQAFAVCRNERTIGADYGQAKYNCEAVLQGNARMCQPSGNLWYCDCMVGCNQGGGSGGSNGGGHYTRTIGASYSGARQNCEIILRGRVTRCERAGNMWYCGCNY